MATRRRQPVRRRTALLAWLLAATAMAAGCQQPMRTPTAAIATGDYAAARMTVRSEMVNSPRDRRYLLDRMRLGVLTLADGYPQAAANVFEEVYEVLRAQGINRDRTVQAVVLNEDLKIWKGEPFEQALAMAYYGMTMAQMGSWDNARAATENALFHLKDFGRNEHGQRLNTQEIAERSLRYERAVAAGMTPEQAAARARGEDYLDYGYVAQPSTFTLGYVLGGVANQQLGRHDEASDHFNQALRLNPALRPMIEVLGGGAYNTVLVVGWGLGPQKEGYGPDNALARFRPRYPSDALALRLQVGEAGWVSYPQVLDVNRMAADHMWNNMEDVRQAKSVLGTGLLYGGLAATAIGADVGSREAMYAGLGAMAAGAFLKAGAHVDVRYADVFPQRFYVVPLNLGPEPTPVELQVEGFPASRITLLGLRGGRDGQVQLRYVRLVSPPPYRGGTAPRWADAREVVYDNPYARAANADGLPYLLGGRDVRPPSERAMDDYQRAGWLRGATLNDLRELYRLEGVRWTIEDQDGYVDRHVLEGGRSLVAPQNGTVGFTRLFGQLHPPYQPRSAQVGQLQRELAATPAPRTPGQHAHSETTP